MNSFVDFVASREQERVAIGPLRTDIPYNRCLVPNTRAVDGWVIYGENVPVEWSRQNRIVEAPEPEIEERRAPSKRARNGTPPDGSVAMRTRSKVEHDVGSSKGDKSKSPVIELHDSPVRDTSLSLITPTVETVGPPLVPTTEVVPFSSPDFKARTYRKKTTACRAKAVRSDVESSSGELPHQSSDSGRTQSEDRGGDFMDITMGFVIDGGTTGGGATDPLLPLEGVASAVGERIISEPTMPTSDLDPPQSRKTTGLPLLEKVLSKHQDFMSRCTYGNAVRKVMFQSFVAVLLDIERTPIKSFNLHKVLEWKAILSELQSMKFDVGFILDWLKATAASCIIRDGEMKLAELVTKIADLEKEIAAKVA
nr:hypothetical protein CFP56_18267 [Quercus suber]